MVISVKTSISGEKEESGEEGKGKEEKPSLFLKLFGRGMGATKIGIVSRCSKGACKSMEN